MAEKSKWQKWRDAAWPVLLAGIVTWCSGNPVVESGFSLDKVGHFAIYGALATAVARHPGLKNWPLLGAWWAILLASAYGLGDEFRQSLTAGIRQYDLADWLADTLGAITAVVLYLRWKKYRRWLETPVRLKRIKPTMADAPEGLATKSTKNTKAECP